MSVVIFVIPEASCHGRLIDPPARSTAWRYGYDTPINYDDNALFCGGFSRQWNQVNKGRCGICGDPFDAKIKDHELPNGKYTKPLRITGNYSQGEEILVKVQLTATHKGFFEFRLCPETSMQKEVTQECLDKNLLKMIKKKGTVLGDDLTKFYITEDYPRVYSIPVILPSNVTCDRCVLQWTYTCGNNWGRCPDGTGRLGCGPQETFRGCSDVTISAAQNFKKQIDRNLILLENDKEV